MFRKIGILMILILVVSSFVGCVDIDTKVKLSEELFEFSALIGVNEEFYTEEQSNEDLGEAFDTFDVETLFENRSKEFKETFDIFEFETNNKEYSKNGINYIGESVKVSTTNSLKGLYLFANTSEDLTLEKTNKNTYLFKMDSGDTMSETTEEENQINRQQIQMLKGLGLNFKYNMEIDFEVISHNATNVNGNIYTWDLLKMIEEGTEKEIESIQVELEFPDGTDELFESLNKFEEEFKAISKIEDDKEPIEEPAEEISEENSEEIALKSKLVSIRKETNEFKQNSDNQNLKLYGTYIRNRIKQSYPNEIKGKDFHGERLKELNVLRGTGNGLELEKTLSRIEGAIIYSRLLGFEEEINAFAINNPNYETGFSDIPKWAEKTINFLHHKGLVSGTSVTTYGSEEDMTEEQFVTLILRALNYNDSKGDFAWDKSIETARDELKMFKEDDIDYSTFTEDKFTRRKMSYIAFNALLQPSKDKNYLLWEKIK